MRTLRVILQIYDEGNPGWRQCSEQIHITDHANDQDIGDALRLLTYRINVAFDRQRS